MKKLLCLVLAAATLLCAAGFAEGFGLKERRPALGADAPAATEAPAAEAPAEDAPGAEDAQQMLDNLFGRPGGRQRRAGGGRAALGRGH